MKIDFEMKARNLVSQMTLEEKASMLRYDSPAIPRLGIPEYNWWNEAAHGVARAGTATVFPQNIGLAATFDEELIGDIAHAISIEARAKFNMQAAHGDRDIYKGLTFWSPNVNIFRDPRWGRGQETYGEDPWLTSRLGVRYVKSLQGDDEYMCAAACAKHFAVHSGPEATRHSFDVRVSEKDLRETYLAAFETLVKEGRVEAVMGAYNRFDGEPCCASKRLLKDILRDEWGFKGHVLSDCWAIRDFHTHHGVTDTAPESAALAMKYGCDLNCGNTYLHLLQAYQEGLVTEEQITEAAVRLMTTRFKLGLFDEDCAFDAIPYSACDSDAHDALALRAARESFVLLKNDGILPVNLSGIHSIAIIGPNANSIPCLEGNYNGTSSRYVTFLEGIRARCVAAGIRVYYSEGCHLFKDRVSALGRPDDRLAEAAALAEMCDLTILCLGLDATMEGEEGDTGNEFASGDKLDLELPASQRRLIAAIQKTKKPFVSVVAAGSALRVEEGNAILHAWYSGQAGGTALADILLGVVSPSGRLPVTFYKSLEDLPPFEDYAMRNRTYRYYEGEALYPFGYGLSYADVRYADAQINGRQISATLPNCGSISVSEVVQVYVKRPDSPWDVRNHSLCAFKRVDLASGESRRIAIDLPDNAFEVIDGDGHRVSGGNHYRFYIGGSQPDSVSVRLTGKMPLTVDYQI